MYKIILGILVTLGLINAQTNVSNPLIVNRTNGTSPNPGELRLCDTVIGCTSPAVVKTASGGIFVGIGTIPTIGLDVRVGASSQMGVAQTTDYLSLFASDAFGPAIYWNPGKDLKFGKGGSGVYNAGGFVEFMRMQSSTGNIGIGTTNPGFNLHVVNNIGNSIIANDSGSGVSAPIYTLRRGDQGTDQKYWDYGVFGSNIQFRAVNDAYSSAVTWLEVDRGSGTTITDTWFPNGNVGIGVSPSFKLDVNGNTNITGTLAVSSSISGASGAFTGNLTAGTNTVTLSTTGMIIQNSGVNQAQCTFLGGTGGRCLVMNSSGTITQSMGTNTGFQSTVQLQLYSSTAFSTLLANIHIGAASDGELILNNSSAQGVFVANSTGWFSQVAGVNNTSATTSGTNGGALRVHNTSGTITGSLANLTGLQTTVAMQVWTAGFGTKIWDFTPTGMTISGVAGVTCAAGLPSASFQTSNGIVIHC